MSEELRFQIEPSPGRVVGPLSDDALRDGLRDGTYPPSVRVRLTTAPLWLPATAWAALSVPLPSLPEAPAGDEATRSAPPDLLLASTPVVDLLRFVVCDGGSVFGPMAGRAVRDAYEGGKHRAAWVAPAGTSDWLPARKLFDRTLPDGARAAAVRSAPELRMVRCPVCREQVLEGLEICSECDEPLAPASSAPSTRGSIPDEPEGASWLRMHWRPLVTFGAILSLILSGITLRYLAPGRFQHEPVAAMGGTQAAPTCDAKCWPGESCQIKQCEWQAPKGVGHVAARPGVAGPFALPADVADALVLDDDRFAIGVLTGTAIHSTRTGQRLDLVSEASQTRKLRLVGDAIYAIGPQHITVLDAKSTRVLKTLELGGILGDVTIGANGRRAFVALPGLHAIAIVSTELHVELDRIRFGDDPVGPVGVDDAGKRALVTTGAIPVAGLPDSEAAQGGAVYGFDPSRLATEQDRVRASMPGNPAAVLLTPDGASAWVALRATNKVVPLELLPSGAVRQGQALDSCDQPEQIELVRRDRRAVVRCHRGRSIEIFDLVSGATVRHLPFNAPVSDLVITPDGEQAVVALPALRDGAVGLVDLRTFEVELVPLTEPPSRVRLSPDGKGVLAISDRSKVAWVIR